MKIDKWNKIENIVGASVFGALGIGALVAAVGFGATHQYAMVGICGVVATAFVIEIALEERRAAKARAAKQHNGVVCHLSKSA